ncbi:MAG: VWA domain-containing protein [Actinomycetota bacterium]
MTDAGSKVIINRKRPGMILLLIDRSYSMEDTVRNDGRTLAQMVADAVNETLYNLCLLCIHEEHEGPRPYFRVGLIGYGMSATADVQAVEPALGGMLAGKEVVTSTELALNPIRVVERNGGADFDGEMISVPEWLEPVAGYATPMCEAIYRAGSLAADFCANHPDSYPPIVINLTDGVVTDEPYAPTGDQHPAGLDEWAERLTTLRTNHGPLRFLNAFVSATPLDASWFPSTPNGLPEPGRRLFDISSPLPEDLATAAADKGKPIGAGARALIVNASPHELAAFLEIGTLDVLNGAEYGG